MKELKDRLANRVQIREEQEMEEMAEMEREKEEERCRRIEHVSLNYLLRDHFVGLGTLDRIRTTE